VLGGVLAGATKICCDQQMSGPEAYHGLLGGVAAGATKICCDQQMSGPEAYHGLLGGVAAGATKICCDQQMLDAEAFQRGGEFGLDHRGQPNRPALIQHPQVMALYP
jgi:hypothetical protein